MSIEHSRFILISNLITTITSALQLQAEISAVAVGENRTELARSSKYARKFELDGPLSSLQCDEDNVRIATARHGAKREKSWRFWTNSWRPDAYRTPTSPSVVVDGTSWPLLEDGTLAKSLRFGWLIWLPANEVVGKEAGYRSRAAALVVPKLFALPTSSSINMILLRELDCLLARQKPLLIGGNHPDLEPLKLTCP